MIITPPASLMGGHEYWAWTKESEMHRGQPLCKNISHLGICANKTDDELLTSYMLPNKVEVDLNVLGVHVENRIHYQINNK